MSPGASSGLHIGGSRNYPSSKRLVTNSAAQHPGPRQMRLLHIWIAYPSCYRLPAGWARGSCRAAPEGLPTLDSGGHGLGCRGRPKD